ncbi:MAG: hypothetical protein JNG86_06125 [Verrucomicrobiaceae bacterium]|nr:hypothetical protein [Verrucomicrobiaceae bacterium]
MKSKASQSQGSPVTRVKKPKAVKGKDGWLRLAGWAKDDPLYDEAMKLGKAWRKAS